MDILNTTTPADHLPPISSGHFSYSTVRGLQYNGIPRMSADTLKELFRKRRGRSETDSPGYKMTKKDVETQLRLYGVPFSGSSMKVGELRELLARVVNNGGCDTPSAEVTQIKSSLKEKYTALNKPHINSIIQARQAEFNKITDPIKAATFSIPLFFHRYFLKDDDGSPNITPDPSKTPNPIVLPGLHKGDRMMIHNAAKEIMGLHTFSDGPEPDRVLAIGWDSGKIRQASMEAVKAAYTKQLREAKERADKKMKEHEEFVRKMRATKKNSNLKKAGTGNKKVEFDLNRFTGRYFIRSEEIERSWPEMAEEGLYMTIVPDEENKGRLVAEFDFGVLEGIMRFRRVGEDPLPDHDHSGEEADSEEVDSEDETTYDLDEALEEEEEPTIKSRKRKRQSQSTTKPQPAPRRSKKTRLSNTTSANPKLLFLWRGRETGEGEIQLDFDQSNKGYIEFNDDDCMSFEGVIQGSFLGEVNLQGYKVANDDGKGINVYWDEFSQKSYEYERVARWR